MPTKVWSVALTFGDNEYGSVVLFSTKELADKWIEKHKKESDQDGWGPYYYDLKESVVDSEE